MIISKIRFAARIKPRAGFFRIMLYASIKTLNARVLAARPNVS